jgi:phospholipase C
MASGQNFDVLDDDDPKNHHLEATSHIADQVERAGLTWKTYQESMGAPCGLTSHGRYAAKHNPFVFFNDINGWDGTEFHPEMRCNEHVVDYTMLDQDIAAGTIPKYVFITPNLDHDMHDGTVPDADKWLEKEVTKIMATDAYKNNGVIIILGDEGGGYPASDDPPFLVISNIAKKGYKADADYDTSSYLKTVEALLGLPSLPCDAERDTVTRMDDLFTIPLDVDPKATQDI